MLALRSSRLLQVPGSLPRIDWSHPLANGLIGYWMPGIGGGVDLTGVAPPLTINSGFTNDMTVEGPSDFSNTSGTNGGMSGLVGTGSPYLNQTAISMYWRGVPMGDNPDTSPVCIGVLYGTADASPNTVWCILISAFGGVNWSNLRGFWNSAGSNVFSNVGVALNSAYGKPCSVAATFLVGGNCNLYGRQDFSGNFTLTDTKAFGAAAPTNTGADPICINCFSASHGRATNGKSNLGVFWNRELTQAELTAFDADPYCFLIPKETYSPIIFLPVTGPTAILMPQACF